jgi:hypothetical protein
MHISRTCRDGILVTVQCPLAKLIHYVLLPSRHTYIRYLRYIIYLPLSALVRGSAIDEFRKISVI